MATAPTLDAAPSDVVLPREIAGNEPEAAGAGSSIEASAAVELASPAFDEVTIARNEVIGITLEDAVTSATARVEDRVIARVTRDVRVDGRTAIPAGARLQGVVALVQRGGKFKEQARLGIRFHTVVLSDNTRLPIQTETIFRDGDAPGREAASKIGASAVIGSILGAVIGGKKGAAIGGSVGAGAGTAVVAAGDGNDAVINSGTPLTVRLTSSAAVLVPHEE